MKGKDEETKQSLPRNEFPSDLQRDGDIAEHSG